MAVRQRKQIRLKKYDYSDAGWYYVTVCTQNRECLFGNIINNKIILNEFGNVIQQCWENIPNYFNNVELDEFQIMPNHVHGIIIIRNNVVGARSSRPMYSRPIPPSLGQIIGYFKYQSTKHINNLMEGSEDPTPTKKQYKFKQIFQRSFYDHIIRNEFDLNRIRQYIRDNPSNWNNDRNNIP